MAVSADTPPGKMTVVVMPKSGDAKDEPALATPLSLTATPEELDAEFTTVLASYRGQRQSLAEQVAATNEVLAAAREASVQKGSKAATRAQAKPNALAAATVSTAADEPDGDDDGDGPQTPSTNAGSATPLTDAPARAGAPDLFG
jgi:PRTRC genetic system protein E